MALLGGLGVMHRNCSFEKRLEMVKKVKRARGYMVEDVATVPSYCPIIEAKERMERFEISGIVVTDKEQKVVGIVTSRDLPFDKKMMDNGKVEDIMTSDVITGAEGISREDAAQLLYKHRIEKLPIVDSAGNLVGLITTKDLKPDFPKASLELLPF